MSAVIREVQSAQDYAEIAKLIAEYVQWLRARYQDDLWFITEVLDKQSLSSELESLPEMYGPPNGRAFVATDGNEIIGCGAYRRFDETSCEMKRVFVPSKFQGAGLGRRICNELLSAAAKDGYESMKLDTGKIMTEATGMYRSLGFEPCPPYYDYPERLMPYFVFLQRPLGSSAKATNEKSNPH
jgi:GNAT superfamily N-acetyltransferase